MESQPSRRHHRHRRRRRWKLPRLSKLFARHSKKGPKTARQKWKTAGIFALVLAVPLAGFGLRKLQDARRGWRLIAWGDSAMTAGNYEDAALNYGRASAHYPEDAALADKWGEALYQASAARPRALLEARFVWQQTRTEHPEHLPTLHRLLSLDAELADLNPSEEVFSELGKVAGTINRLVRDDSEARKWEAIAPIGAWATGHAALENSAYGSSREFDIAEVAAILDRHPTDGTALYYYVLSLTRRAQEVRGIQRGAPDHLLTQAEARLRAALQSPHADADCLYRTAQGLVLVAQGRHRLARTTTKPSSTQPTLDSATAALLALAKGTCEKAAVLTKSNDHDFLPLRILQSQIAYAQGDPTTAEMLLRDAITQRIDSISARIALAQLLNAADSNAAISMLDQAQAAQSVEPGVRSLNFQSSKVQASILKAIICVNLASAAKEPDQVATSISKAKIACDQALADAPNNSLALKAAARLRLLQRRYMEAIQTADLAIQNRGDFNGLVDPDLCQIEALAFWALHEPQEALSQLDTALAVDSSLLPHRLLRSRILLALGKISDAADQAELLNQQAGDDPQVVQLLLDVRRAESTVNPSPGVLAKLNQAYMRLPESTDTQRRQKARQAIAMGNLKEGARLLEGNVSIDSVTDALQLADALLADHQTDRATDVIDHLLVEHPQDARLLYTKKKLTGATPDELQQYAQELAKVQGDPVTADLHAAQLALGQKNPVAARAALDRAKTLKPEDPDLLNLEFECDLQQHLWESAQRCGEKLAIINFDQTNGISYQFELAMARHDTRAAVTIANKLTTRFEKFSPSWVALGLALQSSGNSAAARDAFHRAWFLEPTNLPALKGLAACCLATHLEAEADGWIQQGLSISPGDPDFRNLNQHRLQESIVASSNATPPQWDQVEQLLKEAETASPGDPLWPATESRMWWARGDAGKAESLMHNAVLLAESPASPTAAVSENDNSVQTMVREELLMMLATNDQPAIASESERVIHRYGNGDVASAWAYLASSVLAYRQHAAADPRAATALEEALHSARAADDVVAATDIFSTSAANTGPDLALRHITGLGSAARQPSSKFDRDVRWDILRAGLLAQHGDFSAATAAVDPLMAGLANLDASEQILVLRNAGSAYSQSKSARELDKARDAYIALLARVPDDKIALNNLAYLLTDQVNPPQPHQALVYSQHAFDLMSRNSGFDAQIADTHGWALANVGQLTPAIELLNKVVQQIPSASTEDHLGEAYLMSGQFPPAQTHLRAALDLLHIAEQHGHPDPALRSRLDRALRRAQNVKGTPTTKADRL